MISTAVRNVAISISRIRVRVADLRAQVERRGDGRLAVVFGGHELDRGLGEHPVAGGRPAELGERERARRLAGRNPSRLRRAGRGRSCPSAASSAAKSALRAANAKAQPFHIDSSPARVSRSAVPVVAGDAQGVHGLFVGEPQQHGGGERRGDRAVGGVVPASGADAGGVAEPALDFVGDGRGGDPGFARRRRRAGRRP